MWETLLKRYWRIVLFKESPANTPHSLFLLLTAATLYGLLLVGQWYLVDLKKDFTLSYLVLSALSLLFSYFTYTFLLLKLYQRPQRFLQTTTSLLISCLIIHMIAVPLLVLSSFLLLQDMNRIVMLLFAVCYLLFTLILSIWQFLVTAHIYRLALEVNGLTSLIISLGLLAFTVLTIAFWR